MISHGRKDCELAGKRGNELKSPHIPGRKSVVLLSEEQGYYRVSGGESVAYPLRGAGYEGSISGFEE